MKRQWRLLKKDVQKDPYSFLILGFLALAVLLAGIAKARAHDIYHSWTDQHGASCCNDQDCRPAKARIKGETFQVLIEKEWVDVPKEAVRDYTAPDMSHHVCHKGKTVICFVWGGGV